MAGHQIPNLIYIYTMIYLYFRLTICIYIYIFIIYYIMQDQSKAIRAISRFHEVYTMHRKWDVRQIYKSCYSKNKPRKLRNCGNVFSTQKKMSYIRSHNDVYTTCIKSHNHCEICIRGHGELLPHWFMHPWGACDLGWKSGTLPLDLLHCCQLNYSDMPTTQVYNIYYI